MKRMLVGLLLGLGLAVSGCKETSLEQVYTSVAQGTEVQVPALTGGKIIAFMVEEGQELARGDVIAVVDTIDLVYQKERLLAAREELAAQHQLMRTRLDQALSRQSYLEEKYRRIEALFRQNTTSRQQLDDLANQLDQARLSSQSARQQFQSIAAKQKQIDAQLKTIAKKIKDARIIAPSTGMVSQKYFEAGEAAPPLSPVVELIDLSRMKIKIYISEAMLPHMRPGEAVEVRVDGLETTLPSMIAWISPKAEFTPKSILTPETRTTLVYAVTVQVDNPERILKHGMPVEVLLEKQ